MKPSTALRRRMDAELAAGMEWTGAELELLDAAGRAADRRGELQALWAGAEEATVKVRLSAEIRMLDKEIRECLARLAPSGEPVKSERHTRAARSRWALKTSVPGRGGM